MSNLAYQVVDNMCFNVVVDLVEDAIITVQRGQATPQVAPLLTSGGDQGDHTCIKGSIHKQGKAGKTSS